MKQTFTLLLAFLISISLYAYPPASKLTISSISQAPLRVMVDGSRYKANNSHTLMLSDLMPGYHTVKIYQRMRNFKPSPGNSNGGYRLVYNATIFVRANYHVDITVNRFGKAFKDEQPINGNYYDNDDDWADDNWNNNNEWNENGWDDDWNNNSNSNFNRAMTTQQFERFKTSLSSESFDNTRMNIAKQVLGANYVTSAQVKEMLSFFSFENNKLEMAKYAYKNTIDKNEYYTVGDVFTFSSNKDELMNYIRNYR
jgi:hypothetical protein